MHELDKLLKILAKHSRNDSRNDLVHKTNATKKEDPGALLLMLLDDQELEQDKQQASELATPIRRRTINQQEPNYLLSLPTGQIHIRYDEESHSRKMVTTERREDNKTEPLRSEQQRVHSDKSKQKRYETMKTYSHNWNDGAVATAGPLNSDKATKIIKRFLKKEEDVGNLRRVAPFLDQKKEEQDGSLAREVKKEMKLSSRLRTKIDQKIHSTDRVIGQKKSKEQEFIQKIKIDFQLRQSKPEQPTSDQTKPIEPTWDERKPRRPSRNDFFDLIIRRRKRIPEEIDAFLPRPRKIDFSQEVQEVKIAKKASRSKHLLSAMNLLFMVYKRRKKKKKNQKINRKESK
ncbi:hypothetical protein F9B85_10395 [Heliorestis acidaminivorans]|uniref:Uncharacterized protein n=1 Tax=Heliorestis acidaminivorans TaxID=553427 RepID=A0A6I0EVK9_9FIRM|nr:hypothetical protein [Heliorestis acidaminivorans]KAB2951958.1 hypothetical protein F9B85_10395 [Heliorestis acidaminivorans]